MVSLGELILKFAQVDRVTYFPDGKTRESDTDHTVMLGVVACSLAAKFYPSLDLGKIAQYAFVHDLLEAYAGDTPSFNITPEAKAAKDTKEKEALSMLQGEFGALPWIVETIERYEALDDSEARFIKTLDKCMPKITHILNNGAWFREQGTTREEMVEFFKKQHAMFTEGYGKEFSELLILIRSLMDRVIETCFPE